MDTWNAMKGFSLIELVMVIVLISILAVFAMPLWTGSTINIAAQADQLAADILYTQSLSLTSGQRYYLIEITASTYQIRNSAGTAITYPGTGKTTITLNSGITFGSFTNLPNNLVAFDGQGIPYTTSTTPGTALATAGQMPLTASGTTTKTIFITPGTGMVYIQ